MIGLPRVFATLAILALIHAPALAQAPAVAEPGSTPHQLSPRNANYSIDVTLDVAARTLTGRERLEWTNIGGGAVTELQFHLYYNAWRNAQSSWMRELRLASPRSELLSRSSGEWAVVDVSSIRLTGGALQPADLTPAIRYLSPDDGNADDRTVMAVALPGAIAPGETVVLDIAWTSNIPRTFARTGAVGDYFFLAQWFPKIGVVDNNGAWNCHQFHLATEFFADYGVYDVRMTVPRGWTVGATGQERERRDNPDGTTTHRYYQEDVHDFAWTTSPDYVERRARFDGASEPRVLPPVEMRLLLQREHVGQAERHFEATRAALRYYGEWFGPYPYGHITIVDPAWQSGADGMEYPTLISAGTRWLSPLGEPDPEDVTVHEAGHQFWYGIVASNEFEDAWMDEGLNTFAAARVNELAFPRFRLVRRYFDGFIPWVIPDIAWSRVAFGDYLAAYRSNATGDVQAAPSFRYWPGNPLALSYAKPALWLHTLERALGWPTLQRALSDYFDRWQFRHPRPEDFFRGVIEQSGVNLTPFFDQVYGGSAVFDYGVRTLTSTDAGEGRFTTSVVVERHGDGIFPVNVLVSFADDQTALETWDGRDRWKLFTFERPAKAVFAHVDPDRVLLLDMNFTNNSFSLSPQGGRAATTWALKWMVWLQDLLLTWAFLL